MKWSKEKSTQNLESARWGLVLTKHLTISICLNEREYQGNINICQWFSGIRLLSLPASCSGRALALFSSRAVMPLGRNLLSLAILRPNKI